MNCGAKPLVGNSFCNACGAQTNALAEICIKCGAKLSKGGVAAGVSTKSRLAVTLLSFFLGALGVHRFYAGHIATGVVMLVLTIVGWATSWIFFIGFAPLTAVWIWNLVDFIMAVAGKFKDKQGNLIVNW